MPATHEEFHAHLARLSQPTTEGFLVCLRDSGAVAGVVTIDSIIRGRFQSAWLSYAVFAPAAGRGYMSEGLGLVLRYAFCELRLHRLEANIQPANRASLRLAGRLGFRKEGYAPAMLFIDGAWRDHERWAITREMTDFPPVDPSRSPRLGRCEAERPMQGDQSRATRAGRPGRGDRGGKRTPVTLAATVPKYTMWMSHSCSWNHRYLRKPCVAFSGGFCWSGPFAANGTAPRSGAGTRQLAVIRPAAARPRRSSPVIPRYAMISGRGIPGTDHDRGQFWPYMRQNCPRS
jgi:[ribosomal protein S5]-alanine N-acetyltransferase